MDIASGGGIISDGYQGIRLDSSLSFVVLTWAIHSLFANPDFRLRELDAILSKVFSTLRLLSSKMYLLMFPSQLLS